MADDRPRSERMRSIEALSSRTAQDLAVQMERQRLRLTQAETRLAELTEYLASYASGTGGRSVTAMQLTETHLFVEKLKEAVRLQEGVVDKARSGFEASRARWISQHVRTTALGSAVHRFAVEEARERDLREQHLQDEVAARYHKPPVGD
ncbi:MAG: flagellar export protein FliJ [Pseudomonadales bacterium]